MVDSQNSINPVQGLEKRNSGLKWVMSQPFKYQHHKMVKHTETIRGQKQFVAIIGTVACHECVCACVCVCVYVRRGGVY